MADKRIVGAEEKTLFFRVKSDHSGLVQLDGTTAATTDAHAVLTISTGLIKPSMKIDKFVFDTVKNDEEMTDAIEALFTAGSTGTTGEKLFGCNGTEWDTAGSGSGIPLLAVQIGGTIEGGTKRRLVLGLCTMDESCLNFEAEYKKHSKATLEFTPTKALAAIALTSGFFPTGYYTSPSATLPIDRKLKQFNITSS